MKGGSEKHRIGSEFFVVLEKIQRIHTESKVRYVISEQLTKSSTVNNIQLKVHLEYCYNNEITYIRALFL